MAHPTPVPEPQRPVYRGGATTYGLEHRAHTRAERPARLVAEAVGLGLASLALWLVALPWVGRLWGHALAVVAPALGADGVRMVVTETWFGLEVGVPALVMTMGRPGPIQLFAVGLGTAALMLATVFLPERWRPGVYLARAALMIQASAVLYFALWPSLFPYTLADYLQGMTATGLAIATATPVVLALALHVQDLPLGKKVWFTALALAYSVVLVPLQYAAQGWLIANGTALWMPVLYLFAGVPLHVFALVALYAWAMSWPGRTPALGIPATAAPRPLPADDAEEPLPDVGTPAFGGFDDDPADVELDPLPDLSDVIAASLAASSFALPTSAPVAEKDGFHGDGAVVSVAPALTLAAPPPPRWTSLALLSPIAASQHDS